MGKALKYGNTPVWVHADGSVFDGISVTPKQWKAKGGLYFASKLEYRTYIAIKAFAIKYRYGVEIEQQHKYWLIGSSTAHKVIDWNIDFKVTFYRGLGINSRIDVTTVYVEAKGVELPEYKLKRDLMAILHPPDYSKLIVVHKPDELEDKLIGVLTHD